MDGYANNYAGWFVDDVAVSHLDQVTKYYAGACESPEHEPELAGYIRT